MTLSRARARASDFYFHFYDYVQTGAIGLQLNWMIMKADKCKANIFSGIYQMKWNYFCISNEILCKDIRVFSLQD